MRLPGEFLSPRPAKDYVELVSELANLMAQLQPQLATKHATEKPFVYKDLETCSHVFIRKEFMTPSLTPPYDGPFPVLSRNSKYFTINRNGKHDTVSIDRLKPCYQDYSDPAGKSLTTAPSCKINPASD